MLDVKQFDRPAKRKDLSLLDFKCVLRSLRIVLDMLERSRSPSALM